MVLLGVVVKCLCVCVCVCVCGMGQSLWCLCPKSVLSSFSEVFLMVLTWSLEILFASFVQEYLDNRICTCCNKIVSFCLSQYGTSTTYKLFRVLTTLQNGKNVMTHQSIKGIFINLSIYDFRMCS